LKRREIAKIEKEEKEMEKIEEVEKKRKDYLYLGYRIDEKESFV
jgi:hypothetical protein